MIAEQFVGISMFCFSVRYMLAIDMIFYGLIGSLIINIIMLLLCISKYNKK